MNDCLKLSQRVFNRISQFLESTIVIIKKKQFNTDNHLHRIEQYRDKVDKFTDYLNNLSIQEFETNIQRVYKETKTLLDFFSKPFIKMLQSYQMDSAINSLKGLPKDIVKLLQSFNTYIETTSKGISEYQKELIDKSKEYKKQKTDKNLNEGLSYFLLNEEEDDTSFGAGFKSGAFSAFKSIYRLITFKNNSVQIACNKLGRSLNNLDMAASAADKSGNYTQFFTSDSFGSALGGLLVIVVSFAIVRKLLYKVVNFIKNTWRDFWNWSKE